MKSEEAGALDIESEETMTSSQANNYMVLEENAMVRKEPWVG